MKERLYAVKHHENGYIIVNSKDEQVVKEVFKDLTRAVSYMNYNTPKNQEHGYPISTRFESYHDVIVYEDGYEEWVSIGD